MVSICHINCFKQGLIIVTFFEPIASLEPLTEYGKITFG